VAGGLTPQTGTYTYTSPSRNAVQWGEFVNIATAVAPCPSRLDTTAPCAYIDSMDRAPPSPPSLRDLLLRSDLGRANPTRVDEVLSRATAPQTREPARAD
jgi:hypothetical protein